MSFYDDDEDDVHYISDQDSEDEKPQIQSIIYHTTKKFKNESYAVKILLSDHYREFRANFFEKIRRTNKSVFQAIKREIRNTLNPYRRFMKERIEISEDIQKLYNSFKAYYKERNFNNVFFINYFRDLENSHQGKSKIDMLPKDEVETLNDIQRKVTIIKNLRHYLNTSIRDRIQMNYEQKKELFESDWFDMMYRYLVIDEDIFSKMDEKKVFECLSNQKNSPKLRRPLNDFNVYNYVPILCKGYCQKEAKMFVDKFNKVITAHYSETNCSRCKEIHDNLKDIESQIKSLYLKTCIFCHNINEIMFHPLMFFTLSECLPFYKKQLKQKFGKEVERTVQLTTIPKRFNNLKIMDIQNIYSPSEMKHIYNLLVDYSKKKGIYGNCCFLSEYKVDHCKIEFQPNNDFQIHLKKCPYYHSDLEKRRINKIIGNEICKECIEDGKWKVNEEEKVNCSKGEYCNKFHTRNELFFDERYYRKLYPCTDCTEDNFCEKGDLCPKKHAIDIEIDDIFLPKESLIELEKKFKKLKEKNQKVQNLLKKLSKALCEACKNYINGDQENRLCKFKNCKHTICSKCYDYYKYCPFCGMDNDEDARDSRYKKVISIELSDKKKQKEENIKDNKKNKKNKKKRKRSESDEEDDSDKESSDSSEDSESDDNYDDYSNDNDLLDEGDDEKSLDSDFEIDDIAFPDEKESNSKIGKKIVSDNSNNFNSKKDDSYNNSSYSNTGKRGRGRKRGRGERGGRGRGRNGGRGYRGNYRGTRGNNSYYNNYERTDNYNNEDESYEDSVRRGKGRIRGGRKNNYNNSRVENDYEENSKSNINESSYRKEEDDKDGDEIEMSMALDSEKSNDNIRDGSERGRGRGKVRGGTGRGNLGNSKRKNSSDDSDENSMDKYAK